MKKIIAAALLTSLMSAPSFAQVSPDKPVIGKPGMGMQAGQKRATKMPGMKCDSMPAMGYPHGHDMMGGMIASRMMGADVHMLGGLDISEAQQSKIDKISDELRHNNWATQGLINDETAKLRDLYEADTRDPAAIGKEYLKIFDLKRQMIETYLTAQNRIEEVLTPEQRAKLKANRRNAYQMYGSPMQ